MRSNCSGCSACYLVCPCNAISMKIDSDGFYRPNVDSNLCINCKLCERVCIMNESNEIENNEVANIKLFSAYSNDNAIRSSCSSGGIAYEIANQGIESGYEVCGVRYDEKDKISRHIIINNENKDKLNLLKGSKYIQSFNAEGFRDIIKSKSAIVFGTPCQIAGIDMVLKKNETRDKVILIDIFCHGVPTYNLWYRYLEFIERRYKVGSMPKVVFRNKKLGWHKYFIDIQGNGKRYVKFKEFDPFLKLFLNSACNSESCYRCKFRTKSAADIRLGDYWGKRYEEDDDGYSMVAINTTRGLNYFSKLSNINFIETCKSECKNQQVCEIEIPRFRDELIEELKYKNVNMKRYIRLYPNYNLIRMKGLIKSSLVKLGLKKNKVGVKNE